MRSPEQLNPNNQQGFVYQIVSEVDFIQFDEGRIE
jgi:hypothetical protein